MPGARYAFERNGLATYDVKYKVSSGSDTLLQQGDTAEDYSNVVLVSGAIIHTGDDCDTIELELHYEGKDTCISRHDSGELEAELDDRGGLRTGRHQPPRFRRA